MDSLSFGKHKGKPLADVPAPYLLWAASRPFMRHKRPQIVRAIVAEFRRRGIDEVMAELQVDQGYLDQVTEAHEAKTRRQVANRAKARTAERGRQEAEDAARERERERFRTRFDPPAHLAAAAPAPEPTPEPPPTGLLARLEKMRTTEEYDGLV